MACTSCSSSGGGCSKSGGCSTGGLCMVKGSAKQTAFNWLAHIELPGEQLRFNMVEVMFKNGRKDFFKNTPMLSLNFGDVIAVEASPGHDIGIVTLTGETVRLQMKKKNIAFDSKDLRQVYRKAHDGDIKKWHQAREKEIPALFKAREIASRIGLQMKLSDVEYQGDNTKAFFYFTADGRVDFRELIRQFAAEFHVRIEMRQIGLRQEAGRLGGIGDCGRELCCSTWLTDFRTVSTSAARYQQLSINSEKLTGQCGKLKCCLNYELDVYLDAIKQFPDANTILHTEKGDAFIQKTDIFKKTFWYAYKDKSEGFVKLSLDKVNEIIQMNKEGKKPAELRTGEDVLEKQPAMKKDELLQENIARFDKKLDKKHEGGKRSHGRHRHRR